MVQRFSRYHKYTVGTDLRQQAMALMRGVHLAAVDRSRQGQFNRCKLVAGHGIDKIKAPFRLEMPNDNPTSTTRSHLRGCLVHVQETDLRFKETEREMKERAAGHDREMKERAAETDRILNNLSRRLGDIGNRLGEFVEHRVTPAVVRLFQARGIEVHEVHPGVEAKRGGEAIEIDLLAVNDGILVAVECKSKLTQEHMDAHLLRMEKLKRLLPLYKNHQALGAVAAMVMRVGRGYQAHCPMLFQQRQTYDKPAFTPI